MPHDIFIKYFIEYLFFLLNTWFRYWIVQKYANCTYSELVYLIGTYIVQGFDMKL